MMKLLLSLVALFTLSAAASAQDVTGTWQGTVQIQGRDMRLVFKIANDGGLKATVYNIDQPGPPLPGTVALQGTAVKIALPGVNGNYDGRLAADGGSMEGTLTGLGPNPLRLDMKRANADTAWVIPTPAARPAPMAANASASFEVATIKPSKPDAPGKAFRVQGRTFSTLNTTLSDIVSMAYGLHARQLTGAPAWIETEKYDLSGQPDQPGTPSLDQWKLMVQKLVADRFKLAFHRDKKELSVYALVVDKAGPKLTKNDSDPNGLPALFFRGLGILPVRNATMGEFAGTMQAGVLDRPVVDQTKLEGRYDFTLTWTPDETQFGGLGVRVPPPADNAAAPPGLFTAIQEQLGLKLEATKLPTDVLVIDRVEKPTEN
jgi:uncharacterized protein (TIGR03435 family)